MKDKFFNKTRGIMVWKLLNFCPCLFLTYIISDKKNLPRKKRFSLSSKPFKAMVVSMLRGTTLLKFTLGNI